MSAGIIENTQIYTLLGGIKRAKATNLLSSAGGELLGLSRDGGFVKVRIQSVQEHLTWSLMRLCVKDSDGIGCNFHASPQQLFTIRLTLKYVHPSLAGVRFICVQHNYG